jgi:hypothetical protein
MYDRDPSTSDVPKGIEIITTDDKAIASRRL